MPKTNIDYNNCYFYKLACRDLQVLESYVGHTTDFKTRKSNHKNRCTDPSNPKHHYPVYESIRKHGVWSNWDMVLIEQCQCKNSLDACRKERIYIEQLNATLNQVIPSRTKAEWIKDNPEVRKAICQKYTSTHREQINEKSNEYYHTHREFKLERISCDCGGLYCRVSQSRHVKTLMHQTYLQTLNEITPNDII